MSDLFNQSFFNTTGESGEKLKQHQDQTANQNATLLSFFMVNKNSEYSASGLESMRVLGYNVPITSYRRTLNTLMSKGLIEQIGERNGAYNRKEFTYKLK